MHLVGFIIKQFVTMHRYRNVKKYLTTNFSYTIYEGNAAVLEFYSMTVLDCVAHTFIFEKEETI